jgi:hypothetical protein
LREFKVPEKVKFLICGYDAVDDMHALTKTQKLVQAKRLYLLHPQGLTDIELATMLDIDRASAYRYRNELGAEMVSEARYTVIPSQEDVELALAVLQRANLPHQP